MEVIKQKNAWDCLVATCQMITGCSYDECKEALWDGESYSVSEMVKFCAQKEYLVGLTAYPGTDDGELYEEYGVDTEVLLKGPAYVSVQSEFNESYTHACYYDGEKICDPATGKRRDVEEMHILYWWPVNTIDNVFDRSPIEDEEMKQKIADANGFSYGESE